MQVKTLSAGVVIARKEDGGWLYLLLRAYNYWDFPKGKVAPGENPLQAACRETEELVAELIAGPLAESDGLAGVNRACWLAGQPWPSAIWKSVARMQKLALPFCGSGDEP